MILKTALCNPSMTCELHCCRTKEAASAWLTAGWPTFPMLLKLPIVMCSVLRFRLLAPDWWSDVHFKIDTFKKWVKPRTLGTQGTATRDKMQLPDPECGYMTGKFACSRISVTKKIFHIEVNTVANVCKGKVAPVFRAMTTSLVRDE